MYVIAILINCQGFLIIFEFQKFSRRSLEKKILYDYDNDCYHIPQLTKERIMNQTVNQNLLPHKITASRNVWQAWILLALGLIATAVAAFYVKADAEADAKREFDFACDEIRLKIDKRLNAHAQILRSGAALFDASDSVTRKEWHTFTLRQKVEQQLPGIQGIGFSLLIPHEQLAQHIEEIRNQGFPEYHVRPGGEREVYTSIIYLEPFTGRNLRAFGYDMFSESVRRAAMEMARDTDSAALSGKVVLVQETDKDVQTGTLMYVPVYRKGMPTDTIEQRRAALYGWVYSPYRMNDLMEGILGGWGFNDEKQIRLRVFDGAELALLFDSQPGKESDSASLFHQSLPIDFAGRRWTLHFIQTGRHADFTGVWFTIAGGTTISLLLFGLLLSLINTRFRAYQIADRLTVDLRESEERYKRLSDLTFEGILFHQNGIILDCNESFANMTGYNREELSDQHVFRLLVPEKYHPIVRQNMVKEIACPYEIELAKKNGMLFSVGLQARNIISEGREMRVVAVRDITERKKAEDALRESEENFRTFFDTIDHLLFVLDNTGNMIRINHTVTSRLGFTEAELLGKNVLMVHPEERRDEAGRIVFEMLEGKRDYCPIPVMTKDGNYIPVETRVIRGGWNGKDALFGVTKDISELRLSEEKFSKAFHDSPMLMAISNLNTGYFIDVNDTFLKKLGYKKEEVIGHTAEALGLFADIRQREDALKRISSKDRLTDIEILVKSKSGSILIGLFSIEKIMIQNQPCLLTIMNDITERKIAEKALRDVVLYTRSLIEASIDPFVTINPDGRISDVNTSTEIITGYLREDLIGTDFSNYFTESEKAKAVHTQVFKTGSVHDYELYIRHKNGKITPVLYNASVYRDESDNVIGVFAAARDITKHRQIEGELIRAKEAAEAANHAKGEFIAHISHELRTPLNGILGYTQILKRDKCLTDKQSEEIAIIHRGAEHLLVMINDLLDFSRIEAGKLESENADIVLPELLKTTADIASVQAMQKGIAFIHETSSEIPQKVRGDEKRLRQVLLNLLGNAIKFTEKGSVVLKTDLSFPDQEHILICFQIKDTGIGIPSDQLEKIFEPFHQINRIGKNEGTGLGLVISRKLVRSMGSELYVTSVEGHGSKFWFEVKLLRVGTAMIQSEKSAVLPSECGQDMIAAPPKEELVRLLELLKTGDVIAVQEYAEQLKISDSEFAIFGEKVYQLAKKLQLKKIKLMILGCMEHEI